ncbi:aldehyde dehydrogenase family protein [Agrococcus baldri]|uniref:Aldehyde dehydrogenase n=1 Tax=Agrococcus baldri TaxID=153730 RepID=A0AA87RGG0_9MICO|nr:aldehyde dehydrogenase family protein [Agrococcus baldri]GEK79143.1 aldehyde dehydrogenase [Agrococcus baldri]
MDAGFGARWLADIRREHYIGGSWAHDARAEPVEIINPANGLLVTTVPRASVRDASNAVDAARHAFDEGPWPRLQPIDRARMISQLAEGLWRKRELLTEAMIAQGGCTRAQANGAQVLEPIEFMRGYARLAELDPIESTHVSSDRFGGAPGLGVGHSIVAREPVGVVAAITAFNYPFMLNVHKVGAALAAGCTVVLKPTEFTCLDAAIMAKVVEEETDIPPGVLNVLLGAGGDVGAHLSSAQGVDHVTFTGSTETGRRVMAGSAATLKRVTLELGGKSANVITEDADLDRALGADGGLVTRHAGQGCAALSRVLVHESIHDAVVQRMVHHAPSIRVGDPSDPTTMMGPLINAAQCARVMGYIESGVAEGATLAFGGSRPPGLPRGHFLSPTVFTDVRSDMRIAREEIFGPVVVVQTFSSDEQAVRLANDSEFGLVGAVWSGTLERGLSIASRIRAGTLNVNGPGTGLFGLPYGGYKQSGIGREKGLAGVRDLSEIKTINYTAY